MKFIDAHIHLPDDEYAQCTDDIIAEAKNANVVALVSNAMDLKTCQANIQLAQRYPNLVYAALGIHPWNVQTLTDDELDRTTEFIEQQKESKAFTAIGEIGLDSKYMNIWDKQITVFDKMLHLAEKLDRPAIIHSRGTTVQIVDMLPSYRVKRVLLHWFSNPISALAKAIDQGCYISEGPPTVYSNGIRDVVKHAPLTNLMTETDGPVRYFKQPFNGNRTTPAFIPMVVKAVAELKNMDCVNVAEQILANFEGFFGVRLN